MQVSLSALGFAGNSLLAGSTALVSSSNSSLGSRQQFKEAYNEKLLVYSNISTILLDDTSL